MPDLEFGVGTNITQMHMQKHSDGIYLRALDLELFLRKELQRITELQSDSDIARYLKWLVEQPAVWTKVIEV